MDVAANYRVRMSDGREFGPATMDVLAQWAKEGRVPRDAVVVGADGAEKPVMEVSEIARVLAAPPMTPRTDAGAVTADEEPDVLTRLVPVGNKPALVGYYVAICGALVAILAPAFGLVIGGGMRRGGNTAGGVIVGGLMCIVGMSLPMLAVVLGVKGRRLAREKPAARGRTHAWVAIIGGALGLLLALLFTVGFAAMMFSER